MEEGEVAEQGVGRSPGWRSAPPDARSTRRRRCRPGHGWRAPRRPTGPAAARSRSRTGLEEPTTRTASPGSAVDDGLATARPLGHGNCCAATASATVRPAACQRPPTRRRPRLVAVPPGRSAAAGARRRRRATGRATGRPRTPPRPAPGPSQERPDRAGQGRPADDDDALGLVGVEPVGGGEDEGSVRQGLRPGPRRGPNGSATTGCPRSAAQATAASPRCGVTGAPDEDERALDRRGCRRRRRMPAGACRPATHGARRRAAVEGVGPLGGRWRRAPTARAGETLRCTGPGTPRWRRSRPRGRGTRCCARTGGSPGRTTGAGRSARPARARAEDARLRRRLVRAGAAQLVRAGRR